VIASGNIVTDTGDDLLIVATDSSLPGGTQSVIFVGNIVRRGWAKGIASTGVDRFLVSANIVEETFAGAISIVQDFYYKLGASSNVIIDGNYIHRSGRRFGPDMYHQQPSTVGDSVFISPGMHNVKISNNTMTEGYSNGIRACQSPFLSVIGNTILNHPGDGVIAGDLRDPARSIGASFVVASNQIKVDRVGIVVGGGVGGRVSGNVITCKNVKDVTAAGIQYGSLRGCIIADNIVNLQGSGGNGIACVTPADNSNVHESNNLVFNG
jgi:hypothetical protein